MSGDEGLVARERGLERSCRRLDALRTLANDLLAGTVDNPLEAIARYARDLTDAQVAAVLVPRGSTGRATVDAAAGTDAHALTGREVAFPPADAVDAVPSFDAPPPNDDSADAALPGRFRTLRWSFVPLALGDRALAVLATGRRPGAAPYDDGDIAELQAFATQAAETLEQRRARARLQAYAITEEQQRIAAALLDSVIRRVFAAGLRLNAASVVATDSAVTQRIDDALAELDEAVRHIHTTVFASDTADEPGLVR